MQGGGDRVRMNPPFGWSILINNAGLYPEGFQSNPCFDQIYAYNYYYESIYSERSEVPTQDSIETVWVRLNSISSLLI